MRYSEDRCNSMVIRQTAAGPTDYYPDPTNDRGISTNINDSVFGDGAGGVREGSLAYIHGAFVTSDSWHSVAADFDFSVMPPPPLVRNAIADDFFIMDHDDTVIFQGQIPTGLIANVHPFADPLSNRAGYIAHATAQQQFPEIHVTSDNGLKVRVERAPDSGIFIVNIIWRAIR